MLRCARCKSNQHAMYVHLKSRGLDENVWFRCQHGRVGSSRKRINWISIWSSYMIHLWGCKEHEDGEEYWMGKGLPLEPTLCRSQKMTHLSRSDWGRPRPWYSSSIWPKLRVHIPKKRVTWEYGALNTKTELAYLGEQASVERDALVRHVFKCVQTFSTGFGNKASSAAFRPCPEASSSFVRSSCRKFRARIFCHLKLNILLSLDNDRTTLIPLLEGSGSPLETRPRMQQSSFHLGLLILQSRSHGQRWLHQCRWLQRNCMVSLTSASIDSNGTEYEPT